MISLSHKSGNNGLKIYCIGLGLVLLLSSGVGILALRISSFERCGLLLGGTTALIISPVEFVSAFRIGELALVLQFMGRYLIIE